MDYFENIVVKIIESDNKWVRQNVKINLTVEEKRATGKPSIPRPDIDIVAYNVKTNILELWEVKSFLDSPGVKFAELDNEYDDTEGRYKLLTSTKYRNIIIERLISEWIEIGLIKEDPVINIGLAVGKFYSNDEALIRDMFYKKGWLLKTPEDIYQGIKRLESEPYENNPYVIASKIVFRHTTSSK